MTLSLLPLHNLTGLESALDLGLQAAEITLTVCPDDHFPVAVFYSLIGGEYPLEMEAVLSNDVRNFPDGPRPILDGHADPVAAVSNAGDVHESAKDILVGNDADKVSVVQHREASDIFVQHQHCHLFHRRFGSGGEDLGAHDLLDTGLCQKVVKFIDVEGRGLRRAVFLDVPVRDKTFQLSALDDRYMLDLLFFHQ